jgi:hypothetical protein
LARGDSNGQNFWQWLYYGMMKSSRSLAVLKHFFPQRQEGKAAPGFEKKVFLAGTGMVFHKKIPDWHQIITVI